MTKLDIPFHPNSKDNIHCFQASLMMALSYFDPDTKYSYAKIDAITGFKKENLTWNSLAMLWLAQKGYNVKDISDFDSEAFAKRGKVYLAEYWRPDVYVYQDLHSDLHKEQQLTKRLLQTKRIELIKEQPTLEMLEKHLMSGWVGIVNIDISRLNNTKHYAAHSVVVTAITNSSIFFHDPGSIARSSRRVSRERFEGVLRNGELLLIKKAKK